MRPLLLIIAFLHVLAAGAQSADSQKAPSFETSEDKGQMRLLPEDFQRGFAKAFHDGDAQTMRSLAFGHRDQLRAFVGKLLSDFLEFGPGDDDRSRETLRLATAVARLAKTLSKDEFPLRQVNYYRSWSGEQRALKIKADRLTLSARTAFNQGLYADVITAGKAALELYSSLSDAAGEEDVLTLLGQAERKSADYDKAVEWHTRALNLAMRNRDRLGQGRAYIDLGDVYERRKNHRDAIRLYNKALDVLKIPEDWREAGRALRQLGDIYVASADFEKAYQSYFKALQYAEDGKDVEYIAEHYTYLGYFYRQIGGFAKADMLYGLARKNAELITDSGVRARSLARALNHLGVNMEKMAKQALAEKDYELGADLYRKAIQYEELALASIESVHDKDYWRQGYILRALAQFHRELGAVLAGDAAPQQYRLALDYADQALELALIMKEKEWEGLALHEKGLAQASLGMNAEGMETFQKAIHIWQSIGDLQALGRAYQFIAYNFHEAQGNLNDALRAYTQALEIFQSIHASDHVADAYLGIGHIHEQLGEYEKAKDAYMSSIEKLEDMRSRMESEEHRTAFLESRFKPYEALISLLIKIYNKEHRLEDGARALYISELAKSRIFQDLMAKAGARSEIGKNNPKMKRYIDEERDLIFKLNVLRNSLEEEIGKPDGKRNEAFIGKIHQDMNDIEIKLHTLEYEIETKFPEYSDLKRPAPKAVDELRKGVLKSDEAIISYFVTEKELVSWVITPESLHVNVTGVDRDDLRKKVKAFRRPLEMPGTTGNLKSLKEFDVKVGKELYNILIKPVEDGIKRARIVYISAHDVLYTLPFEALIKDGADTDFDNIPFFLKDYAVSYLPSVSVLYSIRTFKKSGYGKWKKPFAAFADPVFCPGETGGGPEREAGPNKAAVFALTGSGSPAHLYDDEPCRVFPRLKKTADEAADVARIFHYDKDLYMGLKAKETILKNMDLRPYRYILISTHGLLAGEFRVNQPALVLSLAGDDKNDGFLEMDEILGLNIHAELVTLSACNTSGGEKGADKGEGFVGLTRSFMFAGTPSILVTHWKIEDTTSKRLVIETHRLVRTKGKAEALREAKLDLMREKIKIGNKEVSTAHPFFWAGFVMVGDGR